MQRRRRHFVQRSSTTRRARSAVVAAATIVATLTLGAPSARAAAMVAPECDVRGAFGGIHEGLDRDFFAPSTGTVKSLMLFADFPDAPGGGTEEMNEQLAIAQLDRAAGWLHTASYGRLTVEWHPFYRWFRVPDNAPSYWTPTGFAGWERYLTHVVRAADPSVDFGAYDIVQIFASRASWGSFNRAGAHRTFNIPADGGHVSAFVTYGDWGTTEAAGRSWVHKVVAHETLHTMGLPDLYEEGANGLVRLGPWDIMGDISRDATDMLAWQKLKLGWIDPDQVDCVVGTGDTEHEITPLGTAGGTKAVVVRSAKQTAYVIENRQPSALDGGGCFIPGVLLYTIDASLARAGVVTIDASPSDTAACDYRPDEKYNAAFDIGDGRVSRYTDSGFSMEVIAQEAETRRVRVTNPFAFPITVSAGGSYTGVEGSAVRLAASATDPLDRPLSFHWDLDGDGAYDDANGQSLSMPFRQDGAFVVCVLATTTSGVAGEDCATVEIANVRPNLSASVQPAPEGSETTVSAFAWDSGPLDELNGTIDWGDGSPVETFTSAGLPLVSGTWRWTFAHAYPDNGRYDVKTCVEDDHEQSCATHTATPTNVAPTVALDPDLMLEVDEGTQITVGGTFTDPGWRDTYQASIDWGDGTVAGVPTSVGTEGPPADQGSFAALHTYPDDGTFPVRASVRDDDDDVGSASADVIVRNVAPAVSITPPAQTLFKVGSQITVGGTFTDPGAADTHECVVSWDDGQTSPGTIAAGACAAQHEFTTAGVYTVRLAVRDDDGGVGSATAMFVVYDPDAGWVSGGGWVEYRGPAPISGGTGRATFSLKASYARGAERPSGIFDVRADGFVLRATSMQWLVPSGARAQLQGLATLNGLPGYAFLVTVQDETATTAHGWRLKVWEAATGSVVHDDAPSATDDIDLTAVGPLGRGDVTIHR